MFLFLARMLWLIVAGVALTAACAGGGSAAPLVGRCAGDCQEATATALDSTAADSPTAGSELPAVTAGPVFGTPAATPTAGFAPAAPAGCALPAASPAVVAAFRTLAQNPASLVGQLFMVGISSDDDLTASLQALDEGSVGNVVLYGSGWSSAASVQQATRAISADLANNDAGISPFIAGNQEGGEQGTFQAFYGPGFDAIPSALTQGTLPTATLQAEAQQWGTQLEAAGVNLDLAPVMDVVDRATAQQNGPIGRYDREFGYDPRTVADHGDAFIAGMHAAGAAVAIKHFPGLGRVQGNTDFTAQGTTDTTFSGANDPNLAPFIAGIRSNADMVMVGTAIYPAVDGAPAAFSTKIITDLLRGQLGFGGVVVSDDVGVAASVSDFPPAERALRFFAAGGDLLLTVDQGDIQPMTAAVLEQMGNHPDFSCMISRSVLRVLTLKARYGMLPAAQPAPVSPAATPTAGAVQRTTGNGR